VAIRTAHTWLDVVDGCCQTELIRGAFAHDAVLRLEPDADIRAPGAAITVQLCGHWEHEPPCPLAPHHTSASRVGKEVHLRTLFVAEPANEARVRQLISTALDAGQLIGPDGEISRWQLRSSHRSGVLPKETEHTRRLAHS
jgi:hypothetical protein